MTYAANKIAVLPLGAHEAHGPHLPFETDNLIAQAVAEQAAALMPAHLDVTFLPTQTIGYSIEHMRTDGTRTLDYNQAIERWIKIGEAQYRQGIRKFVMLNAHGGNSPLMTLVATELRCRLPMLAVATSWTRFGLPANIMEDEEKALDIHAGFIETSVMLAIAPELVDMTKAESFHNAQADCACHFTHLRAYGRHAFGWVMQDLNPKGAAGNAARANVRDGQKILDHAVQGFITLLDDIGRFDLDMLASDTLECCNHSSKQHLGV